MKSSAFFKCTNYTRFVQGNPHDPFNDFALVKIWSTKLHKLNILNIEEGKVLKASIDLALWFPSFFLVDILQCFLFTLS